MTRINFRTLQEAFNNWTYEESNWRILRKNGTEFIESCKAADRNEAIINVICDTLCLDKVSVYATLKSIERHNKKLGWIGTIDLNDLGANDAMIRAFCE